MWTSPRGFFHGGYRSTPTRACHIRGFFGVTPGVGVLPFQDSILSDLRGHSIRVAFMREDLGRWNIRVLDCLRLPLMTWVLGGHRWRCFLHFWSSAQAGTSRCDVILCRCRSNSRGRPPTDNGGVPCFLLCDLNRRRAVLLGDGFRGAPTPLFGEWGRPLPPHRRPFFFGVDLRRATH